jgi:hypothetical protein
MFRLPLITQNNFRYAKLSNIFVHYIVIQHTYSHRLLLVQQVATTYFLYEVVICAPVHGGTRVMLFTDSSSTNEIVMLYKFPKVFSKI